MGSSEKRILLFDIPSKAATISWSFNMYRIRYLLNCKQIPHDTAWVEYPDIKPLFLSLGIPPSGKDHWGEDAYTCPAIRYTPSSDEEGDGKNIYVSDSWEIARFLEEKFPSPPVFGPAGTGLGSFEEQKVLTDAARDALLRPLFPLLVQGTHNHLLNEGSKAYFRRTRESIFGMTIEEMCLPPPDPALSVYRAKAKENFSAFLHDRSKIPANFASGEQPFVYGNEPSFADMCIATFVLWIKLATPEELWEEVKTFEGGRWDRYLEAFKKRVLDRVF